MLINALRERSSFRYTIILRDSSMTKLHPVIHQSELESLATRSGSHDPISVEEQMWHEGAAPAMDYQWAALIWPQIKELDFTVVVDVAAGYGRNSAKLLEHAEKLFVVDINPKCIEVCQERFRGDDRVHCFKNDGISLKEIDDSSVTLVYSFDAMVHFDSDVVRSYLTEFYRVLQPGGSCFIHHSNSTERPGGELTPPHSRNFMSKALFAHYSMKAGFEVVQQTVIDWGVPALDCMSVIRKPPTAEKRSMSAPTQTPLQAIVRRIRGALRARRAQ